MSVKFKKMYDNSIVIDDEWYEVKPLHQGQREIRSKSHNDVTVQSIERLSQLACTFLISAVMFTAVFYSILTRVF